MGEVVKILLVKEKVAMEEGYDFASKVLEWLFGIFVGNHERKSITLHYGITALAQQPPSSYVAQQPLVPNQAQQQPLHYGQPASHSNSQGILGAVVALYPSQPTSLPSAFSSMTFQDPTWNMDTCATSHLFSNARNLSTIFNKRLFPSIHVCDGNSIPVTNTGHSIIPSIHRPLHHHNVLVTPNIIKNLISVHQFTRDNNCTIEFDAFGFFVKDLLTRHILLRYDSSGDLYLVTKPSTTPIDFLSTSASTWHQHLGHPGDEVLHSIVEHCFDIIHSDLWTSLIKSLFGLKQAPRAWFQGFADDIILTASSPLLLEQIIDSLHNEFDMNDFGALNYFLAKRQHTLSRSSAESKYRGVTNIVAETAWLRNLLCELQSPLSTVTLIYCDIVSVVYMSVNPVQHQRTKQIEIDIHFVRDIVTAGQVRVLHVPSRYQYNDIFTKGLPSALFEEFQSSLSVHPPPSLTAGEY
nr:ribonuclease H-like domain-containing protein [Tanacetum cinerariifolium]GEV36375.1 ribonuclease H-like domain-containing protein [Tanacetum cinerariifolium]